MKNLLVLILCLIGINGIAAEYSTQKEIDVVVTAWSTKWSIESNINSRFEKLTGADPTNVVTFGTDYKAYVADFFAKRNHTASAVVHTSVEQTSQYVLKLNESIDKSFLVVLSTNGESTIIDTKFIKDNRIILDLADNADYNLNVNDGHVIEFFTVDGKFNRSVSTEEPTIPEVKDIVEAPIVQDPDKGFMLEALHYVHSDVVDQKFVTSYPGVTVTDLDVEGIFESERHVSNTCEFTINKRKTRIRYVERDQHGYVNTWSSRIISYTEKRGIVNIEIKHNKEDITVLLWKDNSKVVFGYDDRILVIEQE